MLFRNMKSGLACSALAAAAIGHAAPIDTAKIQAMPLAAQAALVRGLSVAPSSARPSATGVDGANDTTPPSLVSFAITPPADVATPFAQFQVDIQATDDLSGIIGYGLILKGPHGQSVSTGAPQSGLPTRKLSGRYWTDASAYMEPGIWTVSQVELQDANYNYVVIYGTELSQYGNIQVTVVNGKSKWADFTPPVALSGKVLTPSVSASGTARGTPYGPYIAVDFEMSDAGSGTNATLASWCLADRSNCFWTTALGTERKAGKATLHMVGQIEPGQAPGDYVLYDLESYDFANNVLFLTNQDFGGGTDFTGLMPKGHTITVTP